MTHHKIKDYSKRSRINKDNKQEFQKEVLKTKPGFRKQEVPLVVDLALELYNRKKKRITLLVSLI